MEAFGEEFRPSNPSELAYSFNHVRTQAGTSSMKESVNLTAPGFALPRLQNHEKEISVVCKPTEILVWSILL